MATELWGKTSMAFQEKQEARSKPNIHVLLADLKACCRTRNLQRGKQVHADAVECGHDSNIYIASALINMYAKCGSMVKAREVFDSLKHPDVVSYNVVIMGYAENGQGHNALELFNKMKTEGSVPKSVTFVAALKACTSVAVKEGASRWAECRDKGRELYQFAIESGNSDVYVQSTILGMYIKCGSMGDAREVFDSLKQPNVVSWNVLILGYADSGQGQSALDLFTKMRIEGPAPNSVTFVGAFKACTSLAGNEEVIKFRDRGKVVHSFAVECGCDSDVYVQTILVDMYAKCRIMADAQEIFDSMKHPDVVSWTALILGYAENGQGRRALELFTRMRCQGPAPNLVTFLAVFKACNTLGACRYAECKEIHNFAIEYGCNSDLYVQNSLVDMYVKCGSIVDARSVFEIMKHPDLLSWNVLILGYAENGQGNTALQLFTRMKTEGSVPNSVTYGFALKACTSLLVKERAGKCRDRGKAVHNLAVENGCSSDHVQSTLLDMHAKCGSLVDACKVFYSLQRPDVVSWTSLILGYTENGQGQSALDLFTRMKTEGPEPDSITYVAVLKACAFLAVKEGASRWAECREMGKEIQNLALKSDFSSDVYFQSTLIDMYSKCGSMVDAQEVFDSIKYPDVVSWTALILGYADNGQGHSSLKLFCRMRNQGTTPDSVTFTAALKACGLVGALEFGRRIHSLINRDNDFDVVLVTCLVDFYAKCGSLVEAQNVFDLHAERRDVITWNALLAGFSSCGDEEAVFRLFERMQDAKVSPDGVTFLCILTCCSHVGLVEKGKKCFDIMTSEYGMLPSVEHYNCMVNILGSANRLEDAIGLLDDMPCSPNAVTWMTILGACRKWKNLEIGRLAFQSLNKLDYRDLTEVCANGPDLWNKR